VTVLVDPYSGQAAGLFNFDLYLERTAQDLDQLVPHLPEGVHPLEVPQVRIALTREDPFLFALLYLPTLVMTDGQRGIAPEDISPAAELYRLIDPVAGLHLDLPEKWQVIATLWAGAHGHIGVHVAGFITGANLIEVMDLAVHNDLLRHDYPTMWSRKETGKGLSQWQGRKPRKKKEATP
jgi:hypothetical protein